MTNTNRIDGNRVRARLREIGSNQDKLAGALGIPPPRLVDLLKGARRLQINEALIVADHLKVPLGEIYRIFAINPPKGLYGKLIISGYIDATSGSLVTRGDVAGEHLDEIDAPFPGYLGAAARIKGNSMAPRYRDGEIVGFTKDGHDIRFLLNQEVVTELEDGRILLKILHRGDAPNRYTLTSLNPDDPPIVNVALHWAAPIDFHLPRRA